jgi:hypothetical protein
MTDQLYRWTLELPLKGTARQNHETIAKLTALPELEKQVTDLGGKFYDATPKVPGSRAKAAPKFIPAKPAAA